MRHQCRNPIFLILIALVCASQPVVAQETKPSQLEPLTLATFLGPEMPAPSISREQLVFIPGAEKIFKSTWPGVISSFKTPLNSYNRHCETTYHFAQPATPVDAIILGMFEMAAPGQKIPNLPNTVQQKWEGLEALPEAARQTVSQVLDLAATCHAALRNRWSPKAWASITQGKKEISYVLPRATSSFDPHNKIGGIIPASVDTVSAVPLLRLTRVAAVASTKLRSIAKAAANNKAFAEFKFDPIILDTTVGRIVITDAGNSIVPAADIHIDFGGDDTYTTAGTTVHMDRPVAICLELGGNDNYGSETGPGAARGAFGLGIVVDAAGNDTHKAQNGGMGCGLFGAGILIDMKGDDQYLGGKGQWLQGAACAGIGLLLDEQGDDIYRCADESQGFGGPRGIGLLLDRKGKDDYEATSQGRVTKDYGGNSVNMSQGCALGRRSQKYFLAGGIGMLVDGAGNDRYMSRIWGQGAGYFFGMGMLNDFGGNDTYQSTQYSQSIPAGKKSRRHFGTGRDISVGIFVDDAGNDTYSATHVSWGFADDNGIGLFVDRAGKDSYIAPPDAPVLHGFGEGRRPKDVPPAFRKTLQTLGLFIDLKGKDTFTDLGKRKKFSPKVKAKWGVSTPERAVWSQGLDKK